MGQIYTPPPIYSSRIGSPYAAWRDIIGAVAPKAIGVGSPSRQVYAGGNLADYAFALNDLVDFVYHIPHDYAPGTDLFFHVHWSHNSAVSIAGNATFTIFHSYSKGFNQANFSAEKTFPITYATVNLATTPQYRHRIDEQPLSVAGGSAILLNTNEIEVDGLIIATLQLTAIPALGGGGRLFIHTCDIHYQSSSLGTQSKAPDFYV